MQGKVEIHRTQDDRRVRIMPPREDLILFLDLETTGVDVPKDEIIEVGLSMVSTEAGYPEVGSFSRVIIPGDEAFLRMVNKPVVLEMHQKNGLFDEIVALKQKSEAVDNDDDAKLIWGSTQGGAQRDILQWLKQFVGDDTTNIPFGGSGVLHFDRRFIKHFMPRFDARITHWAYDVGVLRRTFMKAGVKYASIDAKTHRALDDARVHAEEWRYYQEVIGGLERS